MASFQLRPIERHELEAYAACHGNAFHGRFTADEIECLADLPLDRTVAVFDGADLVASTMSYRVSMTLPGLVRSEVAAVSDVAVAPTHRRRGLLTSMMRRQLDTLKSANEPIAVLESSEGTIYGRYGYGPATFGSHYVIDRHRAGLLTASSTGEATAGKVRLVDRAKAAQTFPTVFNRYVQTRAGELDRPWVMWTELLSEVANPPDWDVLGSRTASDDAAHHYYACYEQDAQIHAYAIYRVGIDAADHRRAVFLEEFCLISDAGYSSLWHYLLSLDLTDEVRTRNRPVDEPLRYLLEDQRQLRTSSLADRTWVRLVDVESALARRLYDDEGTVVLEVEDQFCPWNSGNFCLSVNSDGVATVDRVTLPGDLALSASALGASYLGGVSLLGMATVGRIVERTAGASRQADRIFGGPRPPFCTTTF